MADSNPNRGGGGGMGAIGVILVVMIIASFMSENHPLDTFVYLLTKMIWFVSILLALFFFFVVASIVFRTAIHEFFDSILEDIEDTRIKEKLQWVYDKLYGTAEKYKNARKKAEEEKAAQRELQAAKAEEHSEEPAPKTRQH